MSVIVIKRDPEQVNKLRKINIYLDGDFLFALANGQSKDITLSAGMHTLQAKIDWCSSPVLPVVVKEDESMEIVLRSNYQLKKSVFSIFNPVVLFGGLLLNVYLKSALFLWSILAISLILLFIDGYKVSFKGLFYYLTFGRKKYLKLEQVNGIKQSVEI